MTVGENGFTDIEFSMEMWNRNHKCGVLVLSVGQSSLHV